MKKRKNRKIKYSEQDYIEKNYIKDGKAVIPIKIKKLDDLYMKHDYLKLDLADEVFDYIEEVAYLIPRNTDIVLEIHYNDEISEKKQDRIRKVFKSNYGSDIDDIDYDISHHNSNAILFFLVGTIFIFLSFLSSSVTSFVANFITEFLSITGWVFIWEMIETIAIQRSELISKRLNKLQLYDAEITFIFDD